MRDEQENLAGRRRFIALASMAVFAAVAGLALVGLVLKEQAPVDRLAFIKDQVRRQFPDAPQMQSEELARRLEHDERLVLLDVRREEEYAVSHLPGALRVDPEAPPELPEGVPQDLPVVAYCSVGWRSSKWVESLREQGIDAMNLEGSIFQWVAEGRPLRRGDDKVDVVHPYGRAWAWLVDAEHRAYEPDGELQD